MSKNGSASLDSWVHLDVGLGCEPDTDPLLGTQSSARRFWFFQCLGEVRVGRSHLVRQVTSVLMSLFSLFRQTSLNFSEEASESSWTPSKELRDSLVDMYRSERLSLEHCTALYGGPEGQITRRKNTLKITKTI